MKSGITRAVLLSALAVVAVPGCVSSNASRPEASNKEIASRRVDLGVEYMKQGQLQLAKDNLDRAEKLDPDNFEAHWALASLSEQLNQPGDAVRHYQTAMRLSPGNSGIANTYATFLCKTGNVDQALPLFDGVIRDPLYRTPWAAATNAAVCLRADKRGADAMVYLERALTLSKDYEPAVFEMADLQLSLGKGDLSRKVIDSYLAIPRQSAELLLIGVRAALSQGDRPAADNYARLLRRDFPNSPYAQALPQLLQGAK